MNIPVIAKPHKNFGHNGINIGVEAIPMAEQRKIVNSQSPTDFSFIFLKLRYLRIFDLLQPNKQIQELQPIQLGFAMTPKITKTLTR